jgi:hypothetical protein
MVFVKHTICTYTPLSLSSSSSSSHLFVPRVYFIICVNLYCILGSKVIFLVNAELQFFLSG